MQVRWSEAHRVAVLDPQGDLGIRTMVEMKNAVSNLLRDGCRVLIVDCRGVHRLSNEPGGPGGAPVPRAGDERDAGSGEPQRRPHGAAR
jgi:hypothetical protein